MFSIPYSWDSLWEEIFVKIFTILYSEEVCVIFEYYFIHKKRYMESIWSHKCVLALIFASTFKITKFTKLKDS